MELASYLAGERWNDHPRCTHPLLAGLARLVNDHTSDHGRQRLATLIPSVIGLTSDDLRVDARIALRAAIVALPVVSAERQRVLAVSVLTCERVLADLDGVPAGRLGDESRSALAGVPDAAQWAHDFTRRIEPSRKGFRRRGAVTTVACACQGIAAACIPDPDGLLRHLLVEAIRDCEASCDDPHRLRMAAHPDGPRRTRIVMTENVADGPAQLIPKPVMDPLIDVRNRESLHRLVDIAIGRRGRAEDNAKEYSSPGQA